MSKVPKNVQINIVSSNIINNSLHTGNPAPMEKEESDLLKPDSNKNVINLQSIQTTANSNELNEQTIISNDSISFKSSSELMKISSDENIEDNYNLENEYFNEIYNNLILDENFFYDKINYNYMSFQKDINYKMRAILVDWLIEVHFHCNFKQKTLFQCIYIIDAFLSKIPIEKIYLQLLGITALFIACKENEVIYPTLKKLAELTENAYTINQLINMEKKILQILKFDIFAPTAEEFYNINATDFGFNEEQKYFGEYFLECSLIDYHLLKYKMSTIAIACGYITMKYYKLDDVHLIFKKSASNIKEKEIKNCARDLCFLVRNLSNSSLGAAKNKFQSEKFFKVAELCEEKK